MKHSYNKFFKILIVIPFSYILSKLGPNSIIFRILQLFRRNFYNLVELKKLNKNLSKDKTILFVYDFSISPPTYGDYFPFLMTSRYFKKKNYKVKTVFITGEYRRNWTRFSNNTNLNKFLNDLKKITIYILNNKSSDIDSLSWKAFKNKYLEKREKYYVFFENRVLFRRPIYQFTWTFNQYLLKKEKQEFIDEWLIGEGKIKTTVSIPKWIGLKKYITFLVRKSPLPYSQDRNLSDEKFITTIKTLLRNFSEYKILVVSCKDGCEHFKKVSKKNKLKCYFSRDFTKSFIGQGNLILNSKANFSYWGGGISQFTFFGKIPYVHCGWGWTYMWPISKYKFYFWQNSNQYYWIDRNFNSFLEIVKKFKI